MSPERQFASCQVGPSQEFARFSVVSVAIFGHHRADFGHFTNVKNGPKLLRGLDLRRNTGQKYPPSLIYIYNNIYVKICNKMLGANFARSPSVVGEPQATKISLDRERGLDVNWCVKSLQVMPVLRVSFETPNPKTREFSARDAPEMVQIRGRIKPLIKEEWLEQLRMNHIEGLEMRLDGLSNRVSHPSIWLCSCCFAKFFRASELGFSQEETLNQTLWNEI